VSYLLFSSLPWRGYLDSFPRVDFSSFSVVPPLCLEDRKEEVRGDDGAFTRQGFQHPPTLFFFSVAAYYG